MKKEDHLWFLSLSEKYWGIHTRTQKFFTELYQTGTDRKELLDLLVYVSINDFWIYRETDSMDRVFRIVADLYDTLMGEELPDDQSKYLVYLYLNFFSSNHESFYLNDQLVCEYIDILEKHTESGFLAFTSNIGNFRNCFSYLVKNKENQERAIQYMKSLLEKNIVFWEESSQIEQWFDENQNRVSKDYLPLLQDPAKDILKKYRVLTDNANSWDSLEKATLTFSDIIDNYKDKIEVFTKVSEKIYYIIYLLNLPGTIFHGDYLLSDLNRFLKGIRDKLGTDDYRDLIEQLFLFYRKTKGSSTHLILDSILELGREVIGTNDSALINLFEEQLIQFGFITPGVTYLTPEWELKIEPNHIKCIRIWLEMIESDPERMKRLLSALVIHLRCGGIFIFDSDLFQKDITKLLNSKIHPVYKQIKQLCRIFPVYFSEIGAEGLLREISTKIDEITYRNDKLIHFLRKQIHTEGNNSHVNITLKVINFWYDPDKKKLKDILPKSVYDSIDVKGKWVNGVHQVLRKATKENGFTLEELLVKKDGELSEILSNIKHDDENDVKRVKLLIELYQLLKEKYKFETIDILPVLRRYHFIDSKDIQELELNLHNQNNIEALKSIFNIMVKLNEIIFDPTVSKGWERISYKRHIAFGIPSMYGYYREDKFEALGLIFRLESTASNLVARIISTINKEYFTAKTLNEIFSMIMLLREGLSLDGIYDQGFDSNLKMFQYSLTSGSFTINQYINIFQFMEGSIKEIINKYFIRPYQQLLNIIIPQYVNNQEEFSKEGLKKKVLRESEIFYRELLSSAFLVQLFDNFISEVLNNLRKQISNLSDTEVQSIMTYNPELIASPLYCLTPTIDNQVFLGSKAYYLKKLYQGNYPVPPGFVITTEVFRRVDVILKIPALNTEIDNLVKNHINELERISGLKLGDPQKPLLLSVRSGAAISMPGAMNTFLNVGLNDKITESLSRQYNYGWTSWDCYRRLLQTWGMAHGLERNHFDQIIINYKKEYNISQKIDFTPETMREIAFTYKKLLTDNGIEFEPDPFLQIKKAIISVFRSWDTPRAKAYREYLHIAEEWGTAVIVQQMIFGNLHKESGSGVLFTQDIHDNIPGINLAGDFSFLSQGEDIVAGLVNTLPISEKQRLKHYRKTSVSLESAFPLLYKRLSEIAHELIEIHGFNHQEIEFTFETSDPRDLYILQTREMTPFKQSSIEVFDVPEKKMKRIGCGIGIGNKVLNGVIIFDMEDLTLLKERGTGEKAVLVRPDTVPDDIEMIFECEGLLTGRGGATSHAAVTAASLGKTGIVNCDDMQVNEKEKRCTINGNLLLSLDPIAIDGTKGIVYQGHYPIRVKEL
jgi:pyruvate,orthophosphate dikinase